MPAASRGGAVVAAWLGRPQATQVPTRFKGRRGKDSQPLNTMPGGIMLCCWQHLGLACKEEYCGQIQLEHELHKLKWETLCECEKHFIYSELFEFELKNNSCSVKFFAKRKIKEHNGRTSSGRVFTSEKKTIRTSIVHYCASFLQAKWFASSFSCELRLRCKKAPFLPQGSF